jgi:hypothetical protein
MMARSVGTGMGTDPMGIETMTQSSRSIPAAAWPYPDPTQPDTCPAARILSLGWTNIPFNADKPVSRAQCRLLAISCSCLEVVFPVNAIEEFQRHCT